MKIIEVESTGRGVFDFTSKIKDVLREEDFDSGVVILYAIDDLCSIVAMEYEPRLISDLGKLVGSLDVSERVKSSLFPISIAIPVVDKELFLGSFQQVCLLDLSGKRGIKKVAVVLVR